MVQIPNIVLNSLWIQNVTRSGTMRERVSIFVSFDTSFEDIKTLRQEMENFVRDKDNSRDFQPDIEVEVVGIAEMNKMELRIEIRHKSNWQNETLRAARRSKFMCALVLALRKVPIYAPGGGDASLGDIAKPTYSVAVTHERAQSEKDKFAAAKEAKRLYPTKKADPPPQTSQFPSQETKAVDAINTRAPHADFSRDEAYNMRELNESTDSSRTMQEQRAGSPDQLDEVRAVLRRESTRGKRQAGAGLSPSSQSQMRVSNDIPGQGMQPGYASPLARNPPGMAYQPYAQTGSPLGSSSGPPPAGIPPPPGAPYQGRPPTSGSQRSGKGPVYKPSGGPGQDRHG